VFRLFSLADNNVTGIVYRDLLVGILMPILDRIIYQLRVHNLQSFLEALRYKSEGHQFDSRLCHWNFSLT